MGSQVFHPTMEWVSNLQALAKEGKALKIYGKSRGKKGCHGEDGAVSRGHIFAAFLVGAGPNEAPSEAPAAGPAPGAGLQSCVRPAEFVRAIPRG